MKFIAFYLIVAAIAIGTIMSVTGALAQDVACTMGSYGQIAAEAEGRCS